MDALLAQRSLADADWGHAAVHNAAACDKGFVQTRGLAPVRWTAMLSRKSSEIAAWKVQE